MLRFLKAKTRIGNTLQKHCFLSVATSALCLIGNLDGKSNGMCRVRKHHHLGQAQQYNITLAVMTMEKEQNAVRE